MGIRLYPDCSIAVEEILAGVPAGTAARLEQFQQSVADRSLRFSFACMVEYHKHLAAGHRSDFGDAAGLELRLDRNLDRLHLFRMFGWGLITTEVRTLFPDQGASFDQEGSGWVSDPELISRILAAQGIVVPPETLGQITALCFA